MKNVFLIRHGNAYDRDWKQAPESSLSETGLKHAEALADRFKEFRVDKVFCSTMERAKETCDKFLIFHPEIKPVYKDNLREVVEEVYRDEHERLVFLKDKYEMMREKVYDTFIEILNESESDQNIFIFTHGHWIRMVIMSILYGSVDGFFSMDVDFASVTVVQIGEGGRMKLELFNDASHTVGLPYGSPGWK